MTFLHAASGTHLARSVSIFGVSKLGEQRVMAKAEALDTAAHDTLEAAYREFRRRMPQGRFTIWIGYQLHPKTFRPQEILALNSQLCDKAIT